MISGANLICLVFCVSLTIHNASAELSGFFTLLQFIGLVGQNRSASNDLPIPLSELGQSRGQCHYSYKNVALQLQRYNSEPDDRYIQHLLRAPFNQQPARKPPIMVKCLQLEPTENVTSYDTTLLMMRSVKEIMQLLKPVGNATKRHEPGSCVIVLFCTPSSLGCAAIAPAANMLPHFFPTLRMAYIDAFRFSQFNAEFGIVGLPTLMIFHQGRPVVKYYAEELTYTSFVTRHTGIKPMKPVLALKDINGPLPLAPTHVPDYHLLLAWCFIFICVLQHLSRTQCWNQIIEMVQRNWRESEETQMEMID